MSIVGLVELVYGECLMLNIIIFNCGNGSVDNVVLMLFEFFGG